jgi:hypothetical protein
MNHPLKILIFPEQEDEFDASCQQKTAFFIYDFREDFNLDPKK